MAPSAVETTPPAVEVKSLAGQDAYKSGDPTLAHVDVSPPTFSNKYDERKFLKHRHALAFRVFAQHGFTEGIAGHITVRDPVEPDTFWVNPFGLHFALITDDDLIRVSEDGKVLEGGANRRLNYAAFAIHSEIHKARPDVNCAAHAHTIYGRAFCATGRKLDMLTQDFCTFYNDHELYPNFGGLVLATEEGRQIAKCLGRSKAALLANHGLLVATPSIEATVGWFILLENCCRIQLAAEASVAASGKPLLTVGAEEAKATFEAIGTPNQGYFMGLPVFQLAEREFGEKTYLGQGVHPI